MQSRCAYTMSACWSRRVSEQERDITEQRKRRITGTGNINTPELGILEHSVNWLNLLECFCVGYLGSHFLQKYLLDK